MQTFTLLPQRWWVARAFGRNPGLACRSRWRDGRHHDLAGCGRRGGGADRSGAVAAEPFPQADWDRELCSLEERRST
jgi:hypothetical protein